MKVEDYLWTVASLARADDLDVFTNTGYLLQKDDGAEEIVGNMNGRELRELALKIDGLVRRFDYVESLEFTTLIHGKSNAYVKGRQRYERSPERSQIHADRLRLALSKCAVSDDVFHLYPESEATVIHDLIARVRTLMRQNGELGQQS